jgi:hypothetical protein
MSIPGFSAEVTLYTSSHCYVKSFSGTVTMGLYGLITPTRLPVYLPIDDGGGGGNGSDFPVIDNTDFCAVAAVNCSKYCLALPKGDVRNNCFERCSGMYDRCLSTLSSSGS